MRVSRSSIEKSNMPRLRRQGSRHVSPGGIFNDMGDENPEQTFSHVVDVLNDLRVDYLHVVEASPSEAPANERLTDLFKHLRPAWNGVYIVNGGYDAAWGELAVSNNRADAVAYGRLSLENPDLPKRLRYGGPLNAPDPKSFYGGTELGYVDCQNWVANV